MGKKIILVIGMARSGTTLCSHLLGIYPHAHIEVEPHAIWKAGNFNYLEDNTNKITPSISNWIREKIISSSEKEIILEKSTPNCIRPDLVHSVFPDAKIVYMQRNPVRCIYSNYQKSLQNISFDIKIILRKYLHQTGTEELGGAISNRKIYDELRWQDIPSFLWYVMKMFYLRNVLDILPFGPKIKNFHKIVKENGLLEYHVQVYKEAEKQIPAFCKLYGENICFFNLESLQNEKAEIKKLYDFCNFSVNDNSIDEIFDGIEREKSVKPSEIDVKIQELLKKQ